MIAFQCFLMGFMTQSETFCFYNPRFWYTRSRCFASPYGFDYGLRPPLRMTYKHSLARVILNERSESNCEAVRGVTEQDLGRKGDLCTTFTYSLTKPIQ